MQVLNNSTIHDVKTAIMSSTTQLQTFYESCFSPVKTYATCCSSTWQIGYILILIRISRSLIRPICLTIFFLLYWESWNFEGCWIYYMHLMLVLGSFDHEFDRVIPRISFWLLFLNLWATLIKEESSSKVCLNVLLFYWLVSLIFFK